ncbi:hypothetical protein E2C01_030500 [Portunus trituberculatus]|uniref:Uncharacterized protein n=1 Tax=Portunus trituberculatus TaxID=210409 RepID=A0A5B7EUY5_PORTR|nr:hypothetical protein [Portunus trituberculatus]
MYETHIPPPRLPAEVGPAQSLSCLSLSDSSLASFYPIPLKLSFRDLIGACLDYNNTPIKSVVHQSCKNLRVRYQQHVKDNNNNT